MRWAMAFVAWMIWCSFGTVGLAINALILSGIALRNFADFSRKKARQEKKRPFVEGFRPRRNYRFTLFRNGPLNPNGVSPARAYSSWEGPSDVPPLSRRRKVVLPETF